MKLKSLAATIVAGGLFAAAGPCFAVPCSTLGTLLAWSIAGSCTDGPAPDSDSTWTFVGATIPLTTTFTLTETQGIGFDVYNVAFGFAPPLTPGAGPGEFISYTATGSGTDLFDASNYDSGVTEPVGTSGVTTTAHVTGAGAGLPLALTSTDGSHAPFPSGETPFGNTLTISVTDNIVTIPTNATLNAVNNSFQTGSPAKAPEPISLALVGVALAGMGLVRRKRKLT